MNKAPNKSKSEPNNENAKVLSDKELEGINGGLESVKIIAAADKISVSGIPTEAIAGQS